MASVPPPTSNYGQRLLPSLVDEIARETPDRVLYSILKTKNPEDGFLDINAQTVARAVNRCAWHIEKSIGRGVDFPTVTYMGAQDVVYAVVVLACIKTGYKVLLNSPRNTLEAHLSLLEKTDCNIFMKPPVFPLPIVQQILDSRPMKVLEIPGTQHWIEDGPDEPYPYDKTFEDARLEPFVVLHTSGSTGLPKPIVQTHGTVSVLDAFNSLPDHGLAQSYPAMCKGSRVYLAFPLFHAAGVSMLLPGAIYNNFTVVLGPFPPSAEAANAIHVHGNVQQSCLAPMTLVELVKDPKHLENLGRLKQIAFGGGPCPKGVGDLIMRKTRLVNVLGSTECAVLPVLLCDPEDWGYMSISPALGHEYRHVSGDLYEQVIVRRPELSLYQSAFATFPDLQEWPMKDLYSKHPTKENVWLYRGRADDIIVLANGEKIDPIDMENTVISDSAVSAALVAGFGREQASLLVEATEAPASDEATKALLERIWSSIESANKIAPSHAQIHRDMVAFTSPEKPMLRAGKGTVQRKLTLDLYAAEIDALYQAGTGPIGGSSHRVAGLSDGAVDELQTVRDIVSSVTKIDLKGLDPSADLFTLGLDSLQVTAIVKEVNKVISGHGSSDSLFIENKHVYADPSLVGLASSLSSLLRGRGAGGIVRSSEDKLERLYKYWVNTIPISSRAPESAPKVHTVLLTGSTGSLGSYILSSLEADDTVAKVVCLNRGPNSAERQQNSQAAKGLPAPSSKVQFLDADFSKHLFGLSVKDYKQLSAEVNLVIHNAWKVDFNLYLDSFNGQIRTVSELVQFSVNSAFAAKIFFVSSIGAVSGASGTYAEQIFDGWKTPDQTGYGQSKFLAERLLQQASEDTAVPIAICRVGQVAGPTTQAGSWPRQEWLPSLVASSKYLGKIPDSLGQLDTVDWIPVNILGNIIVELATKPVQPSAVAVYHAANPQKASWKSLVPVFATSISAETVSLESWIAALEHSKSEEEFEKNPALKLLEFFRKLGSSAPSVLETKETASKSSKLQNLTCITEDLVKLWINQWGL